MSREICIVHTVRARSAGWVGVLEYRVPPVVYRGGCPLGMQLCFCVLFPYPRISTKTSHVGQKVKEVVEQSRHTSPGGDFNWKYLLAL